MNISKLVSRCAKGDGRPIMADIPHLAELARVLAEIAGQTTDANTAQRLMALVHQLMTDAGVPLSSEPPSGSGQATGPHGDEGDTGLPG
jgi:hypothetical protein